MRRSASRAWIGYILVGCLAGPAARASDFDAEACARALRPAGEAAREGRLDADAVVIAEYERRTAQIEARNTFESIVDAPDLLPALLRIPDDALAVPLRAAKTALTELAAAMDLGIVDPADGDVLDPEYRHRIMTGLNAFERTVFGIVTVGTDLTTVAGTGDLVAEPGLRVDLGNARRTHQAVQVLTQQHVALMRARVGLRPWRTIPELAETLRRRAFDLLQARLSERECTADERFSLEVRFDTFASTLETARRAEAGRVEDIDRDLEKVMDLFGRVTTLVGDALRSQTQLLKAPDSALALAGRTFNHARIRLARWAGSKL